MTKFSLGVTVVLAFVLGYTLASRPAQAGPSGGIADSAYRMAEALERIERLLKERK